MDVSSAAAEDFRVPRAPFEHGPWNARNLRRSVGGLYQVKPLLPVRRSPDRRVGEIPDERPQVSGRLRKNAGQCRRSHPRRTSGDRSRPARDISRFFAAARSPPACLMNGRCGLEGLRLWPSDCKGPIMRSRGPNDRWIWAAAVLLLSAWLLRSFLEPILWAFLIALATWPLYRRFSSFRPHRVGPTARALVLTCLVALFGLGPFVFAFTAIARQVESWARDLAAAESHGIPPPDWLR